MNGRVQAWVVNGDRMTLLSQMPGGAEADGPSTNDTDGAGQLKASAGIKSL
jgi:hypothetical protein